MVTYFQGIKNNKRGVTSLKIRKAQQEEIQEIINHSPIVVDEATMGFVKGNKDTFTQMITHILADGGYYLVYVDREIVMGWIGVGRTYNFYEEEMTGMILELYVYPEYRKKGIAKKLLKNALDRLKVSGYNQVQLNVFSGNPAKQLYENLGFYDISTTMEISI